MPNQVAGDFEAVLQVSGNVIDRLMASLHQNAAEQTFELPGSVAGHAIAQALARNLPSFPHSIFLRVGDPLPPPPPLLTLLLGQPAEWQAASDFDSIAGLPQGVTPAHTDTLQPASGPAASIVDAAARAAALDGVRGTVRAQLGVPRIELINAARSFWIEVPIRARYTADLGTTDLPEFINGVVRAQYNVREIVLAGGRKRVLRFAVIPASVSFNSHGPNTGSSDALITRQIARVLRIRFLATDQEIGLPLSTLKAIVSGGFTAVTAGLSLSGEEPPGSIASYSTMLLHGSDFAVGISAQYIEAIAAAAASPHFVGLGAKNKTVLLGVTVVDGEAKVESVSAKYTGNGNEGLLTITVAVSLNGLVGGFRFNNYMMHITQKLKLGFDPGTGGLTLDADGGPNLPPLLQLAASISGEFGNLNQKVDAAVKAARPSLANLGKLTSQLNAILRKLDAAPTSRVTAVAFDPDGIVLRGRISLADRFKPVVEFNQLGARDGYSACPSWLPGGTIDSFHWRWSWFYPTPSALLTPPVHAGSSATYMDRFVLKDENGLPGLHGGPVNLMTGAVCLAIRGKQIDPQSGAQVQVDTSVMMLPQPVCQFFSPQLQLDVPLGKGRLLSKLQRKKPFEPKTVWPEVALIEIGGDRFAQSHNTLVCYLHELPQPEDLRAIGQAIQEADRQDAGLLVAMVLREGLNIPERDANGRSELQHAIATIQAPVLVTEDVQSGWAKAFDLSNQERGLQMRLVTPRGRVVWAVASLDARQLAGALREHLEAGSFPEVQPVASGIQPGAEAPGTLLELAPSEAISLRSLRGAPVVLCFVRADSESSDAQLTRLDRQVDIFSGRGSEVIAIVDQADERSAHALKHRLALNFHVSSDPDSTITRSWGIRLWPTTVLIDEYGLVESVQLGADPDTQAIRQAEPSAY